MTLHLAAIAIDTLGKTALTLRRHAAPAGYVDGRWTEDVAPVVTTVVGTFFQMPSQDVLRLPEGDRMDEMMYFWTRAELRAQTDTQTPDTLTTAAGVVWQVIGIHSRIEGSYYKVAVGRSRARSNAI